MPGGVKIEAWKRLGICKDDKPFLTAP